MKYSIIIATYKRPDILNKTLQGYVDLDAEGIDWDINVIDNGCDQKTENLVRSYQNKLPISYDSEPKKGKNNAVNKALDAVTGDIIIYADDDAIPKENWLREIYEGTERWPNHDVFGGRIIPLWPDGKKLEWTFPEEYYRPAFVVADWDFEEGPHDPALIWGPTMIFRRNIIDEGHRFTTKIGPTGDNNFIIGDEIEFTKRVHKLGFKSIFLPKVEIYHQIRPEQLTKKWIYNRAFILGRTEAYQESLENSEDVSSLFSVPRYLYSMLIKIAIKRFLNIFSSDCNKKVNLGIMYWHIYGKIHQSRNVNLN